MISVSAYPNTLENGYNVTVGGSGFLAGEAYELQGRYIGNGVNADWAMYAEGLADDFGRFGATFGIIKPLGAKYVFRALGASTGYTLEMGV